MNLHNLRLLTFRNYNELLIDFPPEGAIFEGENGSGKTNILEAIYILCTGRSQRGAKRNELIKFDSEGSFIEGEFTVNNLSTLASMGFSRDKKLVMKLNGTIINTFSEWFGQRPVVSFGSDDLQLINGSPDLRRRFIDILCSQLDPDYLSSLISYKKSLLCRNNLLSSNYNEIQCEIYEEQMVQTGSLIFSKRKEILSQIDALINDFYREISGNKESAGLVYIPSVLCDCSSKNEWENVFYNILKARRNKDKEIGFSSVGPHRDDIRFLLNKKPAKTYGSQGQCRSIVLSLKLSSVSCLENYRHEGMIFLVDDAVSELDKDRTSKVYPLIENRGQIFIATPLFNCPNRKSLLKFRVENGRVVI